MSYPIKCNSHSGGDEHVMLGSVGSARRGHCVAGGIVRQPSSVLGQPWSVEGVSAASTCLFYCPSAILSWLRKPHIGHTTAAGTVSCACGSWHMNRSVRAGPWAPRAEG
ncbi:hypothetical protein E2C01_039169 [Portunus trituberculatus]|uniref:Uncharacterized protein n=1 Tax=Portunus trituberculatus TaxID=210409 RepID=A0A5B7FCY2_PORTR|nr:hypothetical protein [Portunus trituberculatus]